MLDAHCHFWALKRGDYDWLAGDNPAFAKLRRDFLPPDYPAKGRVIAVQAAASLAETEFLLQLAAQEPDIAGVIGWVDLSDPAAPIAHLAQNQKLRGLRPMLQDIAQTDWLIQAPLVANLNAMREYGLCFDALVTTRHLPVLHRFSAQNPELSIIIDHAAKPQPQAGRDWLSGLKALGQQGNCSCKLSGLVTELSPADLANPLPALRKIFLRLLDIFGSNRLIWGSDWPVVTLATPFTEWQALTAELLMELSTDEKAAIMGGNAARIYGVSL